MNALNLVTLVINTGALKLHIAQYTLDLFCITEQRVEIQKGGRKRHGRGFG